jgi:hypothetical protein
MTWARASIFLGSEKGRAWLQSCGHGLVVSSTLPAIAISSLVQIVNQPFTRASVELQDPKVKLGRTVRFPTLHVLRHLLVTRGVGAWWLGTDAALLKTVPKYVIAVAVKDKVGQWLAPIAYTRGDRGTRLGCSAAKSVAAGIAGTVLTNPFDVLRNEMFKTEESLWATSQRLFHTERCRWLWRGCKKNIIAAAVPITSTVFLADLFTSWFDHCC